MIVETFGLLLFVCFCTITIIQFEERALDADVAPYLL